MAEIAMVSSRKTRLETAARKGDRSAKKALELSNNPGKFLSTVQIGITLIGILTGIYSGQKIEADLQARLEGFPLLQPYSETLSITLIVVALTYFSLVLGELVPKRIGLVMPEKIAKTLAFPMYVVSLIAAPFIWLLTFSTDLIIRIFNIKNSNNNHLSEEEIKAIIQEGTETGVVQEIEQEIVENVFHLGDRRINTLMTQRTEIYWLDINDPPELIKTEIAETKHNLQIVCKNEIDNVQGIVYSKDLLNSLLNNNTFEIESLIKPALFLPENTKAYKALSILRKTKNEIAIVVDEYGSTRGVLTMNHLVDALVGDLAEQLHENQEIIPREDGTFLVDTGLPLPEFVRYFEIEDLDEKLMSSVDTVGGLVLFLASNIPEVGSKYLLKNISIEIVDMDGRKVDKILVKKEGGS